MKRVIIFFIFFLMAPFVAQAAGPVLYFSDLIDGPNVGLTDDQVTNQGAIVTVWGTNLGSSQGASHIYVGSDGSGWTEAAHVYYWGNADGRSNGTHANLYTTHKMQEISFAISSSTASGSQGIKVAVDSVDSNALAFYVRTSGDFFFVKTAGNGGSDSNPGTWASPFVTIQHAVGGSVMTNGDIVYVCDGVNGSVNIGNNSREQATENNMDGLIVYPGATSTLSTIGNYYKDNAYWVCSKFYVVTTGVGINCIRYSRYTGNRVTGPSAAGYGAFLSGTDSGTGHDGASAVKVLGNYIHDYGYSGVSNLYHTTYFSIRYDLELPGMEIGWNYLKDNHSRYGIHIYDENGFGGPGQYTTPCYIHDNWIENQGGSGIQIGTQPDDYSEEEPYFEGTAYIYNNILINCGLTSGQGATANAQAMAFYGPKNHFDIYVYNNTIYGYGETGNAQSAALWVPVSGYGTFGGTWTFKNNIIVDTKDYQWNYQTQKKPTATSNNLWYNGGDETPAAPPAWDTAPLTSDPKLVTSGSDFYLQSDSPCIDAGSSTVSTIVKTDFNGILRLQGSAYDIGAHEYDAGSSSAPSAPDTTPPIGSIVVNSGAGETESVTVALNLSASDSESGVSQMQLSNNNAEWSIPEAYTTIKSWTLSDGVGTKTVYVKYRDGAGNWSVVYSDTIELVDNAAPGDVTSVSYSVANESLTLNWTNPQDADFEGTMVRYGASSYPTDYTQGILFCDRQAEPGESDTCTGSISEGTYYFSFFTYDQNGNYSHTTHLTVVVSYSAEETYTKVFGDTSEADYQGVIQDTFINLNTDINFSSDALNTYTWPEDQVANAIIMKVALAAIPTGAQVQSAVLYVYMNGVSETGCDDLYDVSVHKIINHNPQLSQCTGYTYDGTNSWTGNTSCYNNVPMAQADIVAAEDNKSLDKTMGYKSWNITGMVQDWIANPETNFGLLLNSDSTASSSSNRTFASSEASDMNQRPKLEITYTTSGGTPPITTPAPPTGAVVVVE